MYIPEFELRGLNFSDAKTFMMPFGTLATFYGRICIDIYKTDISPWSKTWGRDIGTRGHGPQ